MASCRACGAGVGRQFRFCSQCGAAVGVELDLFDLAPPAHDEAIVTYGRPGRFWAAVAGGLAAVVLGLWALSSVGGGGDSADDVTGAGRPTTTRVTARAGTSPRITEPTEPSSPSAAEGTTTATTSTAASGVPTSHVGSGGPLLGEPVGFSLLFGTSDRLRRIDLDSGVVTTYNRGGLPLFMSGDWVLLQSENGTVRAERVADLGGERVPPLWSPSSPGMPLPGPEPNQVWLPEATSRSLVWKLLDLGSRETVLEIDSGASPTWQDQGSTLDPLVVGLRTGEIFEHDGRAYRSVAAGDLVAVGRTVVLVRRCTGPGSCSLVWLDRSTWREAAGAVPAVEPRRVVSASISDDGRLLLYATDSGSKLFDVTRGTEVADVGSWPPNLAVSPDGRWASVLVAGRPSVYDVARGEMTTIAVSTSDAGQVVSVPNP